MKRFWTEAAVSETGGTFGVTLDGRAVKTQGGRVLAVPSSALAEALAAEWAAQGAVIDPAKFALRDLADLAIDVIAPDRAAAISALLRFAETDTLCYRAEPDEPLHQRQVELWEPLLSHAEARLDLHFSRISGVIHQPQPPETLRRLEQVLAAECDFALAALTTLASLAASLVIALAALQPGADPVALWNAANLEEDWQAELWGQDSDAMALRARRLGIFSAALLFAQMVRG